MTRTVPVAVLLVMLASGGVAHAQATLPGGVTLSFDKLYIHENGSTDAVLPKTDPDSLWHYFNLAHCQCGKAMPDFVESKFEYLVLASMGTPAVEEPLQIWVGASCSTDATTRNTNCHRINSADQTISVLQKNSSHVVIPVYDAMTPEPGGGDCQRRVLSATVWGLADSAIGSGLLDYPTTKQISTDAQPPPLPKSFRVSGGEGSVVISWTPADDTSDVFAYQALCLRASDDTVVKPQSHPSPRYMTATTLCGMGPDTSLLMPIDIPAQSDAPDASTAVALPPKFAGLDPTTLCGEVQSATATSLRIDGLQNGVAYKVALLVEDKYQNVAGVYFTSTVTPVPSTDFWEDLHGREKSGVEGGLCLLAETYGDDSALTRALRAFRDDTLGGSRAGRWLTEAYYASLGKLGALVHGSIVRRIVAGLVLAPLVALGLLWHWLGLPVLVGLIAVAWWSLRRRRTAARGGVRWLHVRSGGMAAIGALIVLGASPARAGNGGYQPYWEDNDPSNAEPERVAPGDPSLVHWQVGIRVGPYVPDIDGGAMATGSYKAMFGGARAMPMLDVDRFLWTGFGQLGVGLSLGYMQKFAHTFQNETDPGATNPPRSGADTNTFHLIPMALTATYRFTWFDDAYGVPVVPYVRGGLSYYLWWVTVSDGNFAKVCKDGGMEPACSQNKALGASLGVQGSIGLAVRAERIDASAAMSMRQSGIEHAGIYAELSLAKVDGFGSDKKLSVGDATWFAGVNFEF